MEWLPIIERLGLPMGLLLGVLIALWRIGVYAAHRLFEPDKGIITILAAGHIQLLSEARENIKAQTDIIKTQTELQKAILSHLEGVVDSVARLLLEKLDTHVAEELTRGNRWRMYTINVRTMRAHLEATGHSAYQSAITDLEHMISDDDRRSRKDDHP